MPMATVYLRTTSGRSILDASPEELRQPHTFVVAPEVVARAVNELERRGFTIQSRGATLEISGNRVAFQTHFQLDHEVDGKTRTTRGTVPAELRHLIDAIELSVAGVPLE